jgi:hypothetical protein
MKKNSDKFRRVPWLLIMMFAFLTFSIGDAGGEEWVFYARYGDSFFYDAKNINHPYENLKDIISVWQKTVYDEESVDRIAEYLGPKYANLKESISLIEIDCSKKYAQTKAITYYDSRGAVIETKNMTRNDWKKITPKSNLTELYFVACYHRQK